MVVSVRNPSNDSLMRVHADRLIHVSPFLRFERGQEAEEVENEIPNLENSNKNLENVQSSAAEEELENSELENISEHEYENISDIPLDRGVGKRVVKSTRKTEYAYLFMNVDKQMANQAGVPASAELLHRPPLLSRH